MMLAHITGIPVEETVLQLVPAAAATVPSEMTMISADRMKSVRMAPLILVFSSATRSTDSSATACTSSAWCCWSSSALCRYLCASFSKPS